MKHLLAVGVAAFAMASAFGADYYYKGGNLPWTEPGSYTVDKKEATELPGSSDTICLSANKTAFVDDDSIAFFSRVSGVNLYGNGITFTVDISTNAVFGCWLGDFGGHGIMYKDTWIVKKGAGELGFSKPFNTGNTSYSYAANIDIQGGAYRAAPTVTGVAKHSFNSIRVAENCAFYGVTNGTTVVSDLAGAGDVINVSPISARATSFGLAISCNNADEPTEFSGRILGGKWIVSYASYCNFTGTGHEIMEFQFNGGSLGVSTLIGSSSNPSSVGKVNPDCRGAGCFRYLGTGERTARNYTLWTTSKQPLTFDGGENGGWEFTGGSFKHDTRANPVVGQHRLELTGKNLAAPCVLSNDIGSVSGGDSSFYVTKSGPGTWRMFDNGTTKFSGALAVKDGALEFDTVAEQGRRCALGTAACLYEDKCDVLANLATVDYAWLLGTTGDLSKVGTLSYTGTEPKLLESRKTALAGAGRLKTGAGSVSKYAAGISGLGGGEKEIHFENGIGATNVVSGVSDGADGATVSVVKEGPGHYTLTGGLGFTGDLRVTDGELTLKDINGAKYEWFRYIFKENRCSSTNAAYSGLSVSTGDNYSGRVTRAIRLTEIGLYDADGVRVNQLGSFADSQTNDIYFALEPGQVATAGAASQTEADSSKWGSPKDPRQLFNNDTPGGCAFWACWKTKTLYPTVDNPDSWIVVYQRLKSDAAAAVSYDLCYSGKSAGDQYKGGPTAYDIEASADGVTWETVVSTNNVVFCLSNDFGWLSNDPNAGWSGNEKPEKYAHPNKMPLASSVQQGTYARPAPRSVEVAANASLVIDGGTLTVNRLTTDEFGVGRIEGVTFADAGTLAVRGLSRLRETVDLGGPFVDCTDVGNLANWQVEIEGFESVSRKYRIDVGPDGRLTLAKRQGFLVMIGSGGSRPTETVSLTAPTVVIAPRAPDVVRFAAAEMTNFLSQVQGRTVPLATSLPTAGEAIVLGTNEWSKAAGLAPEALARDGFEILAEAGASPRVYIAGCDDPSVKVEKALVSGIWRQYYERGTYLGMIAFLEDCAGARFYFPGELGTILPRRAALSVPVGLRRTVPAMSVRRHSVYDDGEWFEDGSGLSKDARRSLHNMRIRMETELGPPCCHGSAKLSLITRFGASHPEYFALYGGKRLNVLTGDRDGQLCHTSDVWNEMYLDAASYLRGESASVRGVCYRDDPTNFTWDWNFREGKYVDIMPQDAMKVCSCENCIAAFGGTADGIGEQIWRKTAAFADRLAADGFADARVTQMAYGYVRSVPQVDIPSNVLVTVAETGPWAAAQPEEFRRELDEIAAWRAKLGGRKTWIWTYLCKYGAKNIPDVPCGTPRACARFYQAAAKDVYGIFAESEIDRFLYQALDIYILSRICWDPSVDTDAVIAEYYRLMFGRAANGMEAIADLLEEKWLKEVNANVIDTSEGPSIVAPSERQLWTEIYTPTFLTRLRELFGRSAEAVPAGSPEARRIALFRSAWLDPLGAAARKYADESDPYAALARDARLTNAQLVVDSDFSGTDARWGEIGWLRDNTSSGSAFARDEETFVSAPKSVRLTSTGNMILTQYLSGRPDIPDLKPGCRYRLSFNLKLDRLTPTSASGGGAHVVVNDGANVSFPSTSAFSGTFDWTHFSYEFTTRELEPGKTITPYVRLRIDGAAGTAWFDDVRLDELPLAEAD